MNRSIKVIPFPNIDGAYIVISAHKEIRETYEKTKSEMSFFFDGGCGIGCEWEPDYGPITKIISCDKDFKETEFEKAYPHWFYPYYKGPGYWSQLAVEEEHLPEAFLAGNYEWIFEVLKRWSNNA